jgi:hypothetical protein
MLEYFGMDRLVIGARWIRRALIRTVAVVGVLSISFGGTSWNHFGPVAVAQQDAEDATAGASGADGTVNGVPRDTGEEAPAVTGPGNPLPPPDVILPPSVPALAGTTENASGVVTPGVDPALAPTVGQTSEQVFNAVSDTTVFMSEPGAPQTQESAGLLAFGGPQGAASLISFDVSGTAGGSIVSALLNVTGASSTAGGAVSVIYDYVAPDGLTANEVPGGSSALNFQGVPSWFERVEPDGITSVDVSGSVVSDGSVTFVLTGQAEEQGLIYAIESGVTPQLVLTVSLPA